MGWSNPLWPLSEVSYSVQASDWSGSRCRGKEGDSGQLVTSLQYLHRRVVNLEDILTQFLKRFANELSVVHSKQNLFGNGVLSKKPNTAVGPECRIYAN